jgi:hypothetical protein
MTPSHKPAEGEAPAYDCRAQASGTAACGAHEGAPSGPARKSAKRTDSKGRPVKHSKLETFPA